MKRLAFLLALIATPAFAQQPAPYAPPDQELWGVMAKAFEDLPMSMTAHSQIQQIMANVQREAAARAARAKPKEPAK